MGRPTRCPTPTPRIPQNGRNDTKGASDQREPVSGGAGDISNWHSGCGTPSIARARARAGAVRGGVLPSVAASQEGRDSGMSSLSLADASSADPASLALHIGRPSVHIGPGVVIIGIPLRVTGIHGHSLGPDKGGEANEPSTRRRGRGTRARRGTTTRARRRSRLSSRLVRQHRGSGRQ